VVAEMMPIWVKFASRGSQGEVRNVMVASVKASDASLVYECLDLVSGVSS
jgi:hypothetical protein